MPDREHAGLVFIERSDNAGKTWRTVGATPEPRRKYLWRARHSMLSMGPYAVAFVGERPIFAVGTEGVVTPGDDGEWRRYAVGPVKPMPYERNATSPDLSGSGAAPGLGYLSGTLSFLLLTTVVAFRLLPPGPRRLRQLAVLLRLPLACLLILVVLHAVAMWASSEAWMPLELAAFFGTLFAAIAPPLALLVSWSRLLRRTPALVRPDDQQTGRSARLAAMAFSVCLTAGVYLALHGHPERATPAAIIAAGLALVAATTTGWFVRRGSAVDDARGDA